LTSSLPFIDGFSDEMQHHDILKYRALGLSQERFVQELMTTFRYSMYVTKSSVTSTSQRADVGRFKITSRIFEGNRSAPSLASRLLIVDRAGNLAGTFQYMEQLAKVRQSTTVEFAHYALSGDVRFSFILSPVIAPCLASLSSRPTMQSLHDANVNFAAREGFSIVEREAQELLVALIVFLEKLNIVAFEFTDKPQVSGPSAGRAFKIETITDRQGRAQAGAGSPAGDETPRTAKVGGLNVRNVPKAEVPGARKDEQKPAQQVGSHPGRPFEPASTKPAAETPGAQGKSTTASTLSTDEQVARMRVLGYSDEMIEQLLGIPVEALAAPEQPVGTDGAVKGEQKFTFGEGLSTSEQVDPAAALESATKAKSVIDLLTRFTQHRTKEAKTAAPAAGASAADSTKSGESARVLTTNLPDKRSDGDKAPPVTFSMNRRGDAKPDLVTGGGLKLPQQQSKETTAPGAAFQQGSGSFAQRNTAAGTPGDRSDKQGAAQKQNLKASQIKMPAMQTEAALLHSFRNLNCVNRYKFQTIIKYCAHFAPSHLSADQAKKSPQCQEPKTLKRKTARTKLLLLRHPHSCPS
jgi:hypothetical protein